MKKLKVTEAAVVDTDVKTCLYNDWYKFKQCSISTCKNYTPKTPHNCLAVDRVVPSGNKIISDAELHYYKFSDAGISTKYVSIKRKEAMERVAAVLTLRAFIEYIKDKFESTAVGPDAVTYAHKKIKAREVAYPLKIKRLQFVPWMWKYIVDPKVFKQFKKGKTGTVLAIAHCELLDVTPAKLDILFSLVKETKK